MKNNKKIISCMLASITCLSFVACNPDNSSSSSEIDDPKPEYTSYLFLNGGKSEYSLLLPAEPSNAEMMSASELNTFLSQSVGITLPIVYEGTTSATPDKFISIGKTEALENSGVTVNYAELLTSGYVVKTVQDDVYIAGGNPGVVYGAYEFLEQEL